MGKVSLRFGVYRDFSTEDHLDIGVLGVAFCYKNTIRNSMKGHFLKQLRIKTGMTETKVLIAL